MAINYAPWADQFNFSGALLAALVKAQQERKAEEERQRQEGYVKDLQTALQPIPHPNVFAMSPRGATGVPISLGVPQQPELDSPQVVGALSKIAPNSIPSLLVNAAQVRQPDWNIMGSDASGREAVNMRNPLQRMPLQSPISQEQRGAERNAVTVETGKVKTENGIMYKEVIDSDPITRKPLPGATPRFEVWQQQSMTNAQSLEPVDQDLVKAIGEYRASPQQVGSLRGNRREKIMNAVLAQYPDYDGTQYSTRQGVRRDFTSGATSKRINSLNTVAGHIEQLDEAIDSLGNGNIVQLNRLANLYKVQTGQAPPIVFNAIKQAVAGEIGSLFKSGAGSAAATDPEIANISETISNAQSPEALKSVLGSYVKLIGSRLFSLQNQYERGMGRPSEFKILSPEAEKVFNKFGVSAGQESTMPTEADIDNMSVEELKKFLEGK